MGYWRLGAKTGAIAWAGTGYDLDRHRPHVIGDPAFRGSGRGATLAGAARNALTGLLDGVRPFVFESNQGSHGVVATALAVYDGGATGLGRGRVLFWNRKLMLYGGYDAPRRLLYLTDDVEGGRLRAFRLGPDWTKTREVPFPRVLRRFTRRTYNGREVLPGFQRWNSLDVRSESFRYVLDARGEHDLHTGRTLPLPPGTADGDPGNHRYAGETLFYTIDPEDPILYAWDRNARRAIRVGRFWLAGVSRNGRFLVLVARTRRGEPESLFLVDRKRR